ncbi:pilus assembly protein [Shewanella submarina]|uniref:Pilus assembly protein n=1 Tax=Shewanella submarina TaxID=2016376 RepID=A0ABV7G6T9_9GAMM|nr:pilus assembly protein [Shewanella submarina]MCL1037373.1 pilus assembly protein [Shewanella submarina]
MLKRKQKGQGMTEYIIIVALIAIAAIGAFTMFGDVVRNQTASMAAELSGDGAKGKSANAEAVKAGAKAEQVAKKKGGLKEYNTTASSETTR